MKTTYFHWWRKSSLICTCPLSLRKWCGKSSCARYPTSAKQFSWGSQRWWKNGLKNRKGSSRHSWISWRKKRSTTKDWYEHDYQCDFEVFSVFFIRCDRKIASIMVLCTLWLLFVIQWLYSSHIIGRWCCYWYSNAYYSINKKERGQLHVHNPWHLWPSVFLSGYAFVIVYVLRCCFYLSRVFSPSLVV